MTIVNAFVEIILAADRVNFLKNNILHNTSATMQSNNINYIL